MWMSPTWTSLHMVYSSQQTGLKGSVANVLLSDTRGQKSCKFQALTGQRCFGDIRKIRCWWMIFVQFPKKSQPVTYFCNDLSKACIYVLYRVTRCNNTSMHQFQCDLRSVKSISIIVSAPEFTKHPSNTHKYNSYIPWPLMKHFLPP